MATRKWSDDDLKTGVQQCSNMSELLRHLGLRKAGGTVKLIKKHIERLKCSTGHWCKTPWKKNGVQPLHLLNETPIKNLLIEGKEVCTRWLKKKLLKENLLKNACNICNITNWLGKSLSLQLDHTNGIHSDNRLENLRLLCPNCHSQTETYAGRNNSTKNKCKICKKSITKGSKYCSTCFGMQNLNKHTKITWPSDQELIGLVKELGFLALSKKLGVSDNSIRKRLKRRGYIL